MKDRGILRALAALVVVAPLAIAATASSEELTAIAVKTPPARGFLAHPSGDGVWFAWNHWIGKDSNLYVQRGDKPRIRVNPKGKSAFNGALHRRTLVYEQSPSATDQFDEDLFRYNVRTGQRTKLPDLVNTRRGLESNPTVSGGVSGRYLLFDRYTYVKANRTNKYKVILYNRQTKSLQVLAKSGDTKCGPGAGEDCVFADAGQVNFPWAVWTRTSDNQENSVWKVFRYNIHRETMTVVTGGQAFYGPDAAISHGGTVYVGAGGVITKYPLKASEEVVNTSLGASQLFVEDRETASHVYFSAGDYLYKIVDPLP